jgi:hypothetical protein
VIGCPREHIRSAPSSPATEACAFFFAARELVEI